MMGYIYSSSCDFLVQLVLSLNEHKTAPPSSSTSTRHLMNEEPRNEIAYSRGGHYTTPGVALASHTTLNVQTLCISEQTQ